MGNIKLFLVGGWFVNPLMKGLLSLDLQIQTQMKQIKLCQQAVKK